jgi:hypothetical protein
VSSPESTALGHVMDARAHGLQEARLVANFETEEDDSALELALRIPEPGLRRRMVGVLVQVAEVNSLEGRSELRAAGVLDEAARGSHRARLAGEQAITVGGAALRLRQVLPKSGEVLDGIAFVQATLVVRDLLDMMPAALLLGGGMVGELSEWQFDALAGLVPLVVEASR